ncbi:hypothetical protein [Brevibacillus daliensis]|uniref:hypothetical protein n=1 Tax=Brevibacillus daliensis TaxID=2892995 RepID=UPI001E3A50A4|nr:hypothetical protein [Brevibacillus daliensis]
MLIQHATKLLPAIALALLFTTGCATTNISQSKQTNRQLYFLQSDPQTATDEQNYTPYGTPVNMGSGSAYGQYIRPDSISDYDIYR